MLLLCVGLFTGCESKSIDSLSSTTERVKPAAFNQDQAPVVEFSVPDMMCPHGCAPAVKEILAKQPGAKEVLVDFEDRTAKVAIEEGKFNSDEALAALVDRQFANSSLKEGAVNAPQAVEAAPVQ
jgi:copper chaperone CopZ